MEAAAVIYGLVVVALFVSYAANVVKVFTRTNETWIKAIRVIGIFYPPLGVIGGVF